MAYDPDLWTEISPEARNLRLTPKGRKALARNEAAAFLRDMLARDVLSEQAATLVQNRLTEIEGAS